MWRMSKLPKYIMLIIYITPLCVLSIFKILHNVYTNAEKNRLLQKKRYDFIREPNAIAARFVDYLIKKNYKTNLTYPERYWIISIYDNHPYIMLPQVSVKGKILRFSAIWGPILYKDAWPELYIYRITFQPIQDFPPDELEINFISRNHVKRVITHIESKHKKERKVIVYHNWDKIESIKSDKRLNFEIPCWCKWSWVGIVCNSNDKMITNMLFDKNPVLYYYSFKHNGIIIAAWLPNTVDMFKSFEGVVYYDNSMKVKVKFHKDIKYYDNKNLIVFWGLPKELLEYCLCNRNL